MVITGYYTTALTSYTEMADATLLKDLPVHFTSQVFTKVSNKLFRKLKRLSQEYNHSLEFEINSTVLLFEQRGGLATVSARVFMGYIRGSDTVSFWHPSLGKLEYPVDELYDTYFFRIVI